MAGLVPVLLSLTGPTPYTVSVLFRQRKFSTKSGIIAYFICRHQMAYSEWFPYSAKVRPVPGPLSFQQMRGLGPLVTSLTATLQSRLHRCFSHVPLLIRHLKRQPSLTLIKPRDSIWPFTPERPVIERAAPRDSKIVKEGP